MILKANVAVTLAAPSYRKVHVELHGHEVLALSPF